MAQDVTASWTAEEKDSVRNIAQNLQVSWKKDSTLGNQTFTIEVSTIGGDDLIGINPGAIGSPGNYKYFDESEYVMGMSWERSLNLPLGGLSVGFAEAELDNTTKRFTPDYMGGDSELSTAILPRRPFIINAGFNFDGIDQTIPQFSGITKTTPKINVRDSYGEMAGADYTDFFYNRYLDHELMFTGQRTDQVYETLLLSMGLSTAQYDLDVGINTIPFGLFEKGTKYADIFNELAVAENGQMFQDESGIFRFENRQHYDASPYTEVQRVITTGQVIDAELMADDHIINVVEIKGKPRAKSPRQLLFKLAAPFEIVAGERTELFVDFEDPVLEVDTINITSNTLDDGTGTAGVGYLIDYDIFAHSMKLIFGATSNGFVTNIDLFGRPAKVLTDLYYRGQDDSSVTAYEERSLSIENDYIQDESWANSYSQMILNDWSDPDKLQRITIRAIPELQLGDLISWQGRYWRTYGIRTKLDPSYGFIQELQIVQRTITPYFRIGISTISGDDQIAP